MELLHLPTRVVSGGSGSSLFITVFGTELVLDIQFYYY